MLAKDAQKVFFSEGREFPVPHCDLSVMSLRRHDDFALLKEESVMLTSVHFLANEFCSYFVFLFIFAPAFCGPNIVPLLLY